MHAALHPQIPSEDTAALTPTSGRALGDSKGVFFANEAIISHLNNDIAIPVNVDQLRR
jgi:hypothetical protein